MDSELTEHALRDVFQALEGARALAIAQTSREPSLKPNLAAQRRGLCSRALKSSDLNGLLLAHSRIPLWSARPTPFPPGLGGRSASTPLQKTSTISTTTTTAVARVSTKSILVDDQVWPDLCILHLPSLQSHSHNFSDAWALDHQFSQR